MNIERCPKCKSHSVGYYGTLGVVDGEEVMSCEDCDYPGPESEFWPSRAELHLSPTSCECCGRRTSFGCGHSFEQEIEWRAARLEGREPIDPLGTSND